MHNPRLRYSTDGKLHLPPLTNHVWCVCVGCQRIPFLIVCLLEFNQKCACFKRVPWLNNLRNADVECVRVKRAWVGSVSVKERLSVVENVCVLSVCVVD